MRLLRRTRDDERGIALPTAIILMTVMLGLGVALLAVVDVQSRQSGKQTEGDAAFNLADAALGSTAFVLSRNWPTSPTASRPWTQATTCAQQVIEGGVTPTTDDTIAGQIQNLVAETSEARGGPATASWSVKICDAGTASTWSDDLLARAPYDATGRRTITRDDGTTFDARQLWVRAIATVEGERRAVSSLVQATERPAFPSGYGVLAGKMGFLNGVNTTTDQLLSNGTLLDGLLGPLLSTRPLVTGKIGVRCGLLSELCVEAVASTLTGIPLLGSVGLTSGQVTQYGSATATPPDTIRHLRERAATDDTYFTSVASGASCIPSGTTVGTSSVVFVEKVGDGNQTCTIQAVPGRSIGTVVVGSGRISVTSSAPTSMNTLTGVLYALNRQDEKQSAIVTVNKGARVKGGVFADGGGIVAVYPPDLSLTQTLCRNLLGGLLGTLLCIGPVENLLSVLLDNLPVGSLVSALLPQLSGYGPVIEYDQATVATQTVYGSSGVVQGSFRQVAPGR